LCPEGCFQLMRRGDRAHLVKDVDYVKGEEQGTASRRKKTHIVTTIVRIQRFAQAPKPGGDKKKKQGGSWEA